MTVLPEVNRAVVVALPREPFLDWLNGVEATLPEEERTPITLVELHETPTAYLIPVVETADELAEVLADAWPEIFEAELASWYQDEEYWPEGRTRELFDEWFELRFGEMVFDLGHGALKASPG